MTPDNKEKTVRICCPSKETWLQFVESGRIQYQNGSITEEYRAEFDKCRGNWFVDFGDEEISLAVKRFPLLFIYRATFWQRFSPIFLFGSLLIVLTYIGIIIKAAIQRNRNRHDTFFHQNNDELVQCFIEEDNLLGETHFITVLLTIYNFQGKVAEAAFTKALMMASMSQSRKSPNGIITKNLRVLEMNA